MNIDIEKLTAKQRKIYDNQIDEISDKIVMSAYRTALDCVDQIYVDILKTTRTKIDCELSRLTSNNEQDNNQGL